VKLCDFVSLWFKKMKRIQNVEGSEGLHWRVMQQGMNRITNVGRIKFYK